MKPVNQLVINYHITEKCNYDCHYCYAKWEKTNELHNDINNIKLVLEKLAVYFFSPNPTQIKLNYQSVRLNFAGGEPLLLKQRFFDVLDYAIELGFDVSLITNGHLISDEFITEHIHKLKLLGISYDSEDYDFQRNIGRSTHSGQTLTSERLKFIFQKVKEVSPSTELKINTVVNRYNTEENLSKLIADIKPNKWKVLRVLPVFEKIESISDQQFSRFVERHQSVAQYMSVEDNDSMTGSYLMLGPDGSFFQNGNEDQGYFKSRSLLTTPVHIALAETGFDAEKFALRYL